MTLIERREGGKEGSLGVGGAQTGDWRPRSEALGGSPPPPPPAAAPPGSVSISSPVSWMGGMRASSSDSGTNSGWAMKLWMELRDSGLCSPSYRELRNAFTTLICKKTRGRGGEVRAVVGGGDGGESRDRGGGDG